MKQHPVPQNITKFQFKLIGELTIRQFLYLAAAGVFSVIIFASPWPAIVKFPLITIFMGFGVAFAFIPIQERPLETWVVNFFKSVFRPTQYLWQKTPTFPSYLKEIPVTPKLSSAQPISQTQQEKQKEEQLQTYLARLQEQGKDRLETLEKNYLRQIYSSFGKPLLSAPKKSATLQTASHLNLPKGIKPHRLTKTASHELGIKAAPPKPASLPQSFPSLNLHQFTTSPSLSPADQILSLSQPVKPLENQTLKSPEQGQTDKQEEIKKLKVQLEEAKRLAEIAKRQAAQEKEKTALTINELQKLREQARLKQEEFIRKTKQEHEAAKKQNEELTQSINELKNQLLDLRQTQTQTQEEKQKLEEKIQNINHLLTEAQAEKTRALERLELARVSLQKTKVEQIKPGPFKPMPKIPKPTLGFISLERTQRLGVPSLTQTPNAISGIVVNQKQEALENALVIVKDHLGNPVRALKTNKLGHFLISTPLESGVYLIEVEKEGFLFQPGQLTLKGRPIPPIQIKGRTAQKE